MFVRALFHMNGNMDEMLYMCFFINRLLNFRMACKFKLFCSRHLYDLPTHVRMYICTDMCVM